MKFKEHQTVAVIGTIVHVYSDGHACEVEIPTAAGNPEVLTLDAHQITEPSFTCPTCGRTSHNLNDIQNAYCGKCHVFWGDKKTNKQERTDRTV